MDFEKDQIITLNNKKDYFVFDKKFYNNKIYSLLVNINEDEDIIFVYNSVQEENPILELVNDLSLKKELINFFEKEIDKDMGINLSN